NHPDFAIFAQNQRVTGLTQAFEGRARGNVERAQPLNPQATTSMRELVDVDPLPSLISVSVLSSVVDAGAAAGAAAANVPARVRRCFRRLTCAAGSRASRWCRPSGWLAWRWRRATRGT